MIEITPHSLFFPNSGNNIWNLSFNSYQATRGNTPTRRKRHQKIVTNTNIAADTYINNKTKRHHVPHNQYINISYHMLQIFFTRDRRQHHLYNLYTLKEGYSFATV